MATINNGVLGTISGRIGSLVFYVNRGKPVLRSMPRKRKRPPTVAQQAQRMRFSLIIQFLSPLKSLTGKGYGNSQGKRSQIAQCIAYHAKHTVKGRFPDLEIDYRKVRITTGRLLGADYGEVFSDSAGCVNFTWIDRSNGYHGFGQDQAALIVYNPTKHRHEFLRSASYRASECAMLDVPLEFSGDRLHCWVVFISQCGKHYANSTYLGTVTVAH